MNDFQYHNTTRAVAHELFDWAMVNNIDPNFFMGQGIPEEECFETLMELLSQKMLEEYDIPMCPCCLINLWIEWTEASQDFVDLENGI